MLWKLNQKNPSKIDNKSVVQRIHHQFMGLILLVSKLIHSPLYNDTKMTDKVILIN